MRRVNDHHFDHFRKLKGVLMAAAKLTIGMAHFDDYDGVYFTAQSLALHHQIRDAELVIVDNSPKTPHGREVANLAEKIRAKYVPLPDVVGTSAPRDRVFREASGDLVICLDCHVLLRPGAFDALRDYFRVRPGCRDIVSGPLLADNGGLYGTHFNDVWRAEMWGIWGLAWRCKCHARDHLHFSPVDAGDDQTAYVDVAGQQPVTVCQACGTELPAIGWAGHERTLYELGYRSLADSPNAPPFEIPGMGLGCFAMRRDAWPGFNPHSRGFGGEELYIHEKTRRAGGKAICLPGFAWLHRFGRPGGVRYSLSRYGKCRNYVLEFSELGLSLDPIHEHFVASGLLSEADWLHLVADPIAHVAPPGQQAKPGCSTCGKAARPQPPLGDHNLDTIYDWCAALPRDLERHAPKLRELASQVQHVTMVVKRREWAPFLLVGRAKTYVEYTSEHDSLHDLLHAVIQATEVNPRAPRRISDYATHAGDLKSVASIEPTELLAIDDVHHADVLHSQLERWAPSVSRYIVLRGTGQYGEHAEGGGPGLLVALRRYLRAHPEWSVIYHTLDQYGLTVISRDPRDKPQVPSVIQMAKNLVGTLRDHVADGLSHVTADQLQARLEACTLCEHRTGNRCSACGCYLGKKAPMRAADCPLARWPAL